MAKAEVPPREVLDKTPYAKFRTAKLIDELEAHLNEHDAKVSEMNTYQETLNKRMLELTELRHVLREASTFFADVGICRLDSNGRGAKAPFLCDHRLLLPGAELLLVSQSLIPKERKRGLPMLRRRARLPYSAASNALPALFLWKR